MDRRRSDDIGNFETSNARQWDEESMISTAPSAAPAAVSRQPQAPRAQPSQGRPGQSANNAPRRDFTNGNPVNVVSSAQPTRSGQSQNAGADRASRPRPNPRLGLYWARPEGLVTTRQSADRRDRAELEADTNQYLGKPRDDEDFPGTGIYLWPYDEQDPSDLLGWRYELLNPIRISYKVFIEWQSGIHCLKISSRSTTHCNEHVAGAIKAIRLLIEHAKARAISASSNYIIVPPIADFMRDKLRPKLLDTENNKAGYIELTGAKFSDERQLEWEIARPARLETNYVKFQERLRGGLMPLEPLKGWMRMRVHYGHVILGQWMKAFAEGRQSFDDFCLMMSKPRITGNFDRKFENAKIAMALRDRIISWPERFLPVQGRAMKLEEVKFKDTEILFVVTPQGPFRIESDIDRRFEEAHENEGEYQLGSTRLFRDNRRNKVVEITTIEIQSQVDWEIEVITDNEEDHIPQNLLALVHGSVTPATQRFDCFGLRYPAVSPRSSIDAEVTSIVIRSTVQYRLEHSGYIVEIAIYRTWQGNSTREEPNFAGSVSLFHQDWDLQTESIENTTKERNWPWDLSNFFDNSGGGKTGLPNFISEVEAILICIRDAIKDVREDDKGDD